MSDPELDRVGETLSKVNLAAFLFGEWRPILAETVRWLGRALPLILRDWRLLRRMTKRTLGDIAATGFAKGERR